MNTKTKKIGTVAAALVLTGGLVVGSAGAANAAYPDAPVVAVKVTDTPPAAATVGKAFTIGGKSVKGAKVTISYGKTKKKATKVSDKATVGKSGKFSTKTKIKKTGTYYVKVVVKAPGKAAKTVYYKVKIKAKK